MGCQHGQILVRALFLLYRWLPIAVSSYSGEQKKEASSLMSLTRVEDPLEEEMVTCSGLFAWKIPWTEEADGLQSIGSQRIECD